MAKGFNTVPFGFKRVDNQPFLANEVFDSLESAQTYATTDPTAYAGQNITVVANGQSLLYTIQPDKSLKQAGAMIEWMDI